MAALLWGMYLSPFGAYLTLISAVYIGGIPIAAAFLAGVTSFNVWLHLKALSRHRRALGRYVPGPGHSASGYVVTADEREAAALTSTPDLDIESLWHCPPSPRPPRPTTRRATSPPWRPVSCWQSRPSTARAC